MASIRVLYLEDDEVDYHKYKPVLDSVWQENATLAQRGTLDWNWKKNLHEARQVLEDSAKDYVLFVVDLLLPRNPLKPGNLVPDGLDAVRYAMSRSENLVIIGISVAEGRKQFAGISGHFYSAGGDVFIDKRRIDTTMDKHTLYEQIGKEIEQAARRKGFLDDSKSDKPIRKIDMAPEDPQNLVLRAQLETIGYDILTRVAMGMVTDCDDFHLGYVDPGMSGAFVFRLAGYSRKPFSGKKRELLLKVSRDGRELQEELTKVPDVGMFSIGACPAPVHSSVLEVDGWFAIAYEFVGDALTLLAWLREKRPSSEIISNVFGNIFEEMRKLYTPCKLEDNRSALQELLPSRKASARAMLAIEELWPLMQHYVDTPEERISKEALVAFIQLDAVEYQKLSGLPTGTLVCDCHGDLHCRNILIGLRYTRPHLVDFADRGVKHWATDIARLAASLFLQGWDFGVKSYDFTYLRDWRRIFQDWLSGSDPSLNVPENAAIWHSFCWIRDNFQTIWQPIFSFGLPVSEFRLALATEFVSLAVFVNLPAPKRVLALLASYDIVRSLGVVSVPGPSGT